MKAPRGGAGSTCSPSEGLTSYREQAPFYSHIPPRLACRRCSIPTGWKNRLGRVVARRLGEAAWAGCQSGERARARWRAGPAGQSPALHCPVEPRGGPP